MLGCPECRALKRQNLLARRGVILYRRKDPLNDPQVLELSRLSKDYLVKAAEDFMTVAVEQRYCSLPAMRGPISSVWL
jgi:hypothetical protein